MWRQLGRGGGCVCNVLLPWTTAVTAGDTCACHPTTLPLRNSLSRQELWWGLAGADGRGYHSDVAKTKDHSTAHQEGTCWATELSNGSRLHHKIESSEHRECTPGVWWSRKISGKGCCGTKGSSEKRASIFYFFAARHV